MRWLPLPIPKILSENIIYNKPFKLSFNTRFDVLLPFRRTALQLRVTDYISSYFGIKICYYFKHLFQFNTILGRLEKLGIEQEMQIRSVGSDSSHQVSALDSKTRSMIEETRSALKSYKVIEEGEREKLEARVFGLVDKSLAHRDTNIVRYWKCVVTM